jgi:hypothetical protein
LTVILVYPATANLHATDHELLWSPDGERWTSLETTDSTAQQQAQATIDAPGFLVVGGVPIAAPSGTGDDDGSRNTLSTILLIGAGASLLIGIGLLIRARGAGD